MEALVAVLEEVLVAVLMMVLTTVLVLVTGKKRLHKHQEA